MNSVSVIIPAYNAGAFIENCVNSILKQTYSNFEIVVINDGSTDNTEQLLLDMQKKDKRIRVFSQENSGVSSARNTALSKAQGDFITFVDADDDLPPTSLEDMVSLMGDDVDYVIASHNEIRLKKKPLIKENMRFSAGELNDRFSEYDRLIWYPWAKMLRRSIIVDNNLKYDTNVSFGEDHIFNLSYSKYIKNSVVVTDKNVYNYYCIRGGLCSKYYDNMDKLERYILDKINDYFGGNFPEKYRNHYSSCYMRGCFDYYIVWLSSKNAQKKIADTIETYKDYINDDMLSDQFTPKECALIKDNDIKTFMREYIRNRPKQTLWRKVRRTVRRFLELLINKFKKKS